MISNWFCADCNKVIYHYCGVGYDGPAENGEPVDVPCGDFPQEWIVLCRECAEKRGLTDE